MSRAEGDKGDHCLMCNSNEVNVINSRPRNNGHWRWRRRDCAKCGHRWSTIEVPEHIAIALPKLLKDFADITQAAARSHAILTAAVNAGVLPSNSSGAEDDV